MLRVFLFVILLPMSPTVAPSWKKYEEEMHSDDPKKAREAGNKFILERDWETKHNDKLKEWEKERKEDIAKQKPDWVKKVNKTEKQEKTDELTKFLKGGEVNYNLRPTRGFILIKIIKEELKTPSGIILTNDVEIPNEKADVLRVGDSIILAKNILPPPCQPGDKVLLKKMAGLEVKVKGEDCKLIQFSDVLATLE